MQNFDLKNRNEGTIISDSILTLDKTITVVVSTPIVNAHKKVAGVLAGTFDVNHKNFNQMFLGIKVGLSGYAYLVDN